MNSVSTQTGNNWPLVPGIVLSTLSQEDNLMVVRLEKVTFAIISRTDSLKEEWTLKGCIYNGAS